MRRPLSIEKFEPFEKSNEFHLFQKGDTEEEIGISGSTVYWSRGGKLHLKFVYEQTVKQAIFCNFEDLPPKCLVVLLHDFMKIYSTDGDVFNVPLPCKILSIWPMKEGLIAERLKGKFESSSNLPIFFSLRHPLSEFSPICYTEKGIEDLNQYQYFRDPDLKLIHVCSESSYVLTFNQKSNFHYLFKIYPIYQNYQKKETNQEFFERGVIIEDDIQEDEAELESDFLFKFIKTDLKAFQGPKAECFMINNHIYLWRKSVNTIDDIMFNNNGEFLHNYRLTNIQCFVPVNCLKRIMFLIVEENIPYLILEKTKFLQLDFSNLKVDEIITSILDSIIVKSSNQYFRIILNIDFSTEIVEKCFDVLQNILPFDIYISLLRIFMYENSMNEWDGFKKSFFKDNKIHDSLYSYLDKITFGLHLLYETFKLNILTHNYLKPMAELLLLFSSILNWKTFKDHYYRDFQDISSFIQSDTISKEPELPNIYQYIYNSNYSNSFPTINNCNAVLELNRVCKIIKLSNDNLIQGLLEEKMTKEDIDLLSFGIGIRLKSILNEKKMNPPNNLSYEGYLLIDREDLANFIKDKDHNVKVNFFDHQKGFQKNIFPDKRMDQVYEKLSSSKPFKSPEEHDLTLQQTHLLKLSKKVCSAPIGRGMITLSSRYIKQSDTFEIPPLVIAIKTNRNVTVNLDTNLLTQNALNWPEFHNGVASGLCLMPHVPNKDQVSEKNIENITKEWIIFHKPKEPNYSHAGFMFALGIQGHLSSLLSTDVYSFLTARHHATSCAVLLGMSISKRGSQDNNVTKALSLHIPSLTHGTDIEIPLELQASSILGLGFLYLGTSHRFISEVILTELIRPPDDSVLDRDVYALSAGFALGLINLGKWNSLNSIADLKIPEKLKLYMIGGRKKKNENSIKDHENSIKIKESETHVNVDVIGPGATMALCLIYLKSNNELISSYMELPHSKYALEYIRPHIAFLRILSQSLIMWKDIKIEEKWIHSKIIKIEPEDNEEEEEFTALNTHIITGCCMAIGIKYAGTNSRKAYNLILSYLKKFETSQIDLLSKEVCSLNLILALSLIVSGTGDVDAVKLIYKYRKIQTSYGGHMAISMALGFVFLGACRYSLSTNHLGIASLLISLYPRFPSFSNENKFHLQLFRHIYVLAAEFRLLEAKDVETNEFTKVSVKIVKENETMLMDTPCLLPELSSIQKIQVLDDRYYPLEISVDEKNLVLLKDMIIYLKKKKEKEKNEELVKRMIGIMNNSILVWNLKISMKYLQSEFIQICKTKIEKILQINHQDLKNYFLQKPCEAKNLNLSLIYHEIPSPFWIETNLKEKDQFLVFASKFLQTSSPKYLLEIQKIIK